MKKWTTLSFILLLTMACGKEGNLAECEEGKTAIHCSERTPEENVRLALERGDFDTAISLLLEMIAEDRENYRYYSLLGGVYAANAGVFLKEIATTQFTDGGNFITLMTAVLPDPGDVGDDDVYLTKVDSIKSAVTWLKAIPEALRAETAVENFSSSARFQLTFFQAAYSVMYLNQFAINTKGDFDESKFATMTEAEAITFLQNFAEAGALQEGEEGGELAAKVNDALAQIESQEGSSNKEKLMEFVAQDRS